MRLEWREKAVADLERIDQWLSQLENADSIAVRRRIYAAASKLERMGDIGRPARIEGLRELSVRSAPYVLLYRVGTDAIEIIAVFHTAQER